MDYLLYFLIDTKSLLRLHTPLLKESIFINHFVSFNEPTMHRPSYQKLGVIMVRDEHDIRDDDDTENNTIISELLLLLC